MSEFKVLLGDVAEMAKQFDREGETISAAADKLPRAAPDTGDGGLNGEFDLTLETMGFLEQSLGAHLTFYGGKLRTVHDSYRGTDGTSSDLFNRLMQER